MTNSPRDPASFVVTINVLLEQCFVLLSRNEQKELPTPFSIIFVTIQPLEKRTVV
jgi:hypothetical protein